jgi:hypothetical protein
LFIAARDDMVQRTGIFNSQRPRHTIMLTDGKSKSKSFLITNQALTPMWGGRRPERAESLTFAVSGDTL